jgi:NDP-sugar pyrophosphorylase family protein
LASLPERGCVVRQGYRNWVDAGDVVAGFVDESRWLELGTPADYASAQFELLRLGGVDASLVDASAQIDPRSNIRTSVIGRDCRVLGAVTLERVILWPGAMVDQDLTDVIVTSAGRHVTCR